MRAYEGYTRGHPLRYKHARLSGGQYSCALGYTEGGRSRYPPLIVYFCHSGYLDGGIDGGPVNHKAGPAAEARRLLLI